jgi:hypothetical protein
MIEWLGAPLLTQRFAPRTFFSAFQQPLPRLTSPVLTTRTNTYRFVLVRITRDCRDLIVWSEGPTALTVAQADVRFRSIIPRVTGVGEYPGEGLELQMIRDNRVVQRHTFVSRPVACSQVGWLGQVTCPPGEIPAGTPPNQICVRDPSTSRCAPGMHFNAGYGRCIPDSCPGAVRDLSTGLCTPIIRPIPSFFPTPSTTPSGPLSPAPGACLSTQDVVAMQPCFYLNPVTGVYEGPPELVQGVDTSLLVNFCLRSRGPTLELLNADLPLCDITTVPSPPSCITPEQRRLLTYCAERGFRGDDPASNFFCWFALKAPAELQEWVRTPNCAPGQVPVPVPPPAPAARRSLVVPVLVGAAVVGAAALLLMG